jgi:hypothetical protein
VKIQILKTTTKRNLRAAMKTKLTPVVTMKLKRKAVGKMKEEEMAMVMVEMVVAMVEMAAVVDENKMSKDDIRR